MKTQVRYHPLLDDLQTSFLYQAALKVYPDLRKRYQDIRMQDVLLVAQEFRRATMIENIPFFLDKSITERLTPLSPRREMDLQLPLIRHLSESPVTKPPGKTLSLLQALKGPFQAVGIKL